MVTVELRRVPAGEDEYRKVATLVVRDDGTHELDDPQGLFPFDMHMLIGERNAEGEAVLRRVEFAEDPQAWARNLGSRLRTGYLVPVITEDSSEAAGQGDLR